MLSKIIEFSIRNKLIIGLFTISLLIMGIYQTTQLPIDAVPDITNNQVQVITVAPSYGATDIERLVTFPIEQANSNIAGLKEIRSFSRFGLSLVTIVFSDETDIYWARQQVAERLQKVQTEIPKGIGIPEMGPISTGLGEIFQYVVRPKEGYESKYTETELRTIQDWIVRRQLIGVKGVADVSSFGGKLKQYEIAVHPNKLQSYNITIQDVFAALEKNNQNTGGAYIEKGATVLFIRSEGLIGNKEDLENITIKKSANGNPLFIRDVADINIGHATRYGAMCYNDKGEVAGAVVMMLKGANSNEVIREVKKRVAQIQTTLPAGVVIEPFLDRTKMVNHAIGTVEQNLLEGALIVVFILVIFLGNWRAGMLVASVIPLSMLFAITLMNIFGVSGNLMSLGALDFGLIVDGAVIIVEAVMHQLSHSKKFNQIHSLSNQQMDEQVIESSSKMMNSAVFGQIIILIVYLPIFTLQGIEGKMFKPMAQTVAFALLGAFVLSLTYIPMMSALFLSKKIKHQPNFSDRVMFKMERGFQHSLARIIKFPKTVLTLVFSFFVMAMIILFNMGGEFIPALEEGDFAVDTRVLTGSNLNTTIESTQKAAHILKTRFSEVEKVVTKIGSGEIPTDPMPMEASDMMVILKDKKEWKNAKTFKELADTMSKALAEVPGITTGFQFPVQMRFNELMTGARQDVVCKIFGENLDTLSTYAEKLGKIVQTVEGSKNLYVEPVTGLPQIIIKYNRSLIAQYQLNIEDVNRIVNTAFAGQSTGLVFEDEKRFNLVVRLQTDKRRDIDDVKNLLIPTPNGTQIPLYLLAEVSIKNGPNQIQREDAKRRIVVGFNVGNRDVQSIVGELESKVQAAIKLPAGYFITYGGAFENLNEAKKRLMIAVPISLLMILVMLHFAFNSLKQGLLIYTAIPLSATGGIFFLAMRGMPFSISAGVGFIALFGVAVLNGIVLIAEFNRLKEAGNQDPKNIVLMGTKVRLRPVLMTALVASLGFLPMAISNGSGAEVQRPLATVVIGGLLIATFLTLYILPILYILFEDIKPKNKKTKMKTSIIAIICLLITTTGLAQAKIDLKSAIDSALNKNRQVTNERLRALYQRKLVDAANVQPKTNISFEAGQMNSHYFDNKISITQGINLGQVNKSHASLLNQEWKSSILSVELKEIEIKKTVTQVYYHLLLLANQRDLLTQQDSNYANLLNRATLKLQKGEANILEQSTAEIQRTEIRMRLQNIEEEEAIARLAFQLLLNTAIPYHPLPVALKMDLLNDVSTSQIIAHPILRSFQQQIEISKANTQFEKAKLLPELNIGINNMSMIGTGADNILYPSSTRFTSAQIGLGIPILGKGQKAKISASKIQEHLLEEQFQEKSKQLELELQGEMIKYENSFRQVKMFEDQGIPNAKLLIQTANKQMKAGEINYLEWVLITQQANSIFQKHLEAISHLNTHIITIHYLLSK